MCTKNRIGLALAVTIAWVAIAGAQVVSGGDSHTVLATPAGAPWAWGHNGEGRLGDNSTTTRVLPASPSGLTGVVRVGAGERHTLAVKGDGTLWAWGAGNYGQRGDGTQTGPRITPLRITTWTNVTAAAGGRYHSVALRADGSVWAWGYNGEGQVGDGTTTQRLSPVQVSGLSSVAVVAVGGTHSLALKSDGTVWAWGSNSNGQLGDGTQFNRTSPVQVSGLTSVVAIAAGDVHSLAVKSDGSVWAWGANTSGQLGDASETLRKVPVSVVGAAAIASVAAGERHSLALRQDGTVWAWGDNTYGQLGNDSVAESSTAIAVQSVSDAVAIGAGYNHSVAISSGGTVWAWGNNGSGRLGDGTTLHRRLPVSISEDSFAWKVGTPTFAPVPGAYQALQNVTVASATVGATLRYTVNGSEPTESDPQVPANGIVAVTASLTLKARAWKVGVPTSNVDGGAYTLSIPAPAITPSSGTYSNVVTAVISTSVSGATIRYTTDGSDPTASSPAIPSGGTVAVTGAMTVKAKVWRTGWTTSATTTRNYAFKVATPALTPTSGAHAAPLTVTITSATAGAVLRYTLAGAKPTENDPVVPPSGQLVVPASTTLRVLGFVPGWTTSDLSTAIYRLNYGLASAPVVSPPGGTYSTPQTISITSGTSGAIIRFTLDGSEPTLSSPVYQGPFTIDYPATVNAKAYRADHTPSATGTATYTFDIEEVAAPSLSPQPGSYSGALEVTIQTTSSGATVRYTTNGLEPTESDPQVPASGVVLVDRPLRLRARAFVPGVGGSTVRTGDYLVTGTVAAGSEYSVALKYDGTVWGWGKNASGQLGDGTTTARWSPVPVTTLSNVIGVAAGHSHVLALRRDGTVWAWGLNDSGQIGDGSTTTRLAPVQVPGLTNVAQVAAGYRHSLALRKDGTVWAWGRGNSGQLGNGAYTNRTSPVQITTLTGVTDISAGEIHNLALKTDGAQTGSVWAWGESTYGQLGTGASLDITAWPIAVLPDATVIGAGVKTSFALPPAGTLLGWGENQWMQVGDGTQTTRSVPTPTRYVGTVAQVFGGGGASLNTYLLAKDGSLWTWGDASDGALSPLLGIDIGILAHPLRVATTDDTNVTFGYSSSHQIAGKRDGTVWTWGTNAAGQLGLGAAAPPTDWPTQLPTFSLGDASWLTGDPDGDGADTWRELQLGTDPRDADTNDDGVLDGAAAAAGLSGTSADVDGDGLANAVELTLGTDPLRSDTDGDGVNDAMDAFPLDPARNAFPPPDPGDSMPPHIELIAPASAVPLP